MKPCYSLSYNKLWHRFIDLKLKKKESEMTLKRLAHERQKDIADKNFSQNIYIKETLIKSARMDGKRFFAKTRFGKRRNTVCISSFSSRKIDGKGPASAVADLFRASLTY